MTSENIEDLQFSAVEGKKVITYMGQKRCY